MILPELIELGKELNFKKTDSEVVGVIENCSVKMYREGGKIIILELHAPDICDIDKNAIIEILDRNKINRNQCEWPKKGLKIRLFGVFKPYPKEKTKKLLDELIAYFMSKYPSQKPECQYCSEQREVEAYCINNTSVFICNDCYRKTKNEIDNENMERQTTSGNYLMGFVGALLFSIPGILLTIVFFVFLDRMAALSAVLYVFLGILGYKKFGGKTSTFGIFVIVLAALLMVTIGMVISYSVDILKELKSIDIDRLLYILKMPEVQTELIINIVLSYVVSIGFLIFQIIQMAKEWKVKRIQKAGNI